MLSDEEWMKIKGWSFDKNNDFVDKDGNIFNFKADEERYECVHSAIRELVFKKLKSRRFERLPVPSDNKQRKIRGEKQLQNDPLCPQIFATKDVATNPNLLVIVQGLGQVPPGQWARKLFTNGKRGQWNLATQFSYVERALHLGWAVILCDPNHDENVPKSGRTRAHHVQRVWEDLVRPSKAKCVMFVSFSAGTTATLDLIDTMKGEFRSRVQAVALLDGENGKHRLGSRQARRWLMQHSWSFRKRTSRPTAINEESVDTDDHDGVPGVAVGQVFEYLQESHSWFKAGLAEDNLNQYVIEREHSDFEKSKESALKKPKQ